MHQIDSNMRKRPGSVKAHRPRVPGRADKPTILRPHLLLLRWVHLSLVLVPRPYHVFIQQTYAVNMGPLAGSLL